MRRTRGSRGSAPVAESNFRDGERSVHGDAAAARQPDPLGARRRRPRLARAARVYCSPTPFGYVFDYYHEAIEFFYEKGRLPIAADCWQCYHPPLFYLLGLPFYAVGVLARRRAGLGARVGAARADAPRAGCRRGRDVSAARALVQFLARDRALTAIGVALVLDVPVSLHLLLRPRRRHRRHGGDDGVPARVHALCRRAAAQTWQGAMWVGALAGLAASAKYSGLIALATAGVVMGLRVLFSRDRLRTLAYGAIIARCRDRDRVAEVRRQLAPARDAAVRERIGRRRVLVDARVLLGPTTTSRASASPRSSTPAGPRRRRAS